MGISTILTILAEGMKGVVSWMVGYSKPSNQEARLTDATNKKKDKFNKALKEGNLDEIRKKLPSS